jgi:cyclophilin family peptidyl-prolyl cis-trans isomerase/HEAT repeat protein
VARTRAALAAALLALAPAAVRAQDQSSVADLAQVLMLEDRRAFDAAAFQRAVQHPDTMVRSRAAMAIGRIGERAGTPLLLQLLADRDQGVRAEAAFALGTLGDTAAVGELAQLLDGFPPVVTGEFEMEVVTALCKIGGDAAATAVERLLQRHPPDGPNDDRASATALLQAWRLRRASPVARRLAAYVRSAGGEWRRNAAYSAGRLRVNDAAAVLLELANDPDALTRAWAVRGMSAALADSSGVGRDAFTSRIRGLLGDPDAQVRINALRALATFRDPALAPLAAPDLTDGDQNVMVQAAIALGALGGTRAAQVLAERFAGAGTFALRRAILLALGQADPQAALAASRGWRTDPDWSLRAGYAEMLGVAATAAARQQLFELLGDGDPRVVAASLGALEQFTSTGDSALVSAARARLAHADPIVRAAALSILGRERDPASIGELLGVYRRAEREEPSDARLAAVNALAEVAEAGPAVRADVERRFLGSSSRSGDYLVRRAVAERFGEETHRRYWGEVRPVETGRSAEDYREAVRRYVLQTGAGGSFTVTIETERGTIVIQLEAAVAPLTVENFVRLVDRRYFDNSRWHRVVPNFVIQGGDPRGDGTGGPGTTIRDEINRRRYDRGVVGMALSGPDTGGSQFFITHSPQPHLDGGYTVFGKVVSGLDVLDESVQGDRIRRIFR